MARSPYRLFTDTSSWQSVCLSVVLVFQEEQIHSSNTLKRVILNVPFITVIVGGGRATRVRRQRFGPFAGRGNCWSSDPPPSIHPYQRLPFLTTFSLLLASDKCDIPDFPWVTDWDTNHSLTWRQFHCSFLWNPSGITATGSNADRDHDLCGHTCSSPHHTLKSLGFVFAPVQMK